jgi:hypothetical protein
MFDILPDLVCHFGEFTQTRSFQTLCPFFNGVVPQHRQPTQSDENYHR